ncbi:hypothetical protein E3N88_03684 [Mikania micrantha]|uniref:Uncharacterized protein n=1 Tax=Mikania micrantha TaxID=192012 RepID=A0A5N6Q9K8_9ASTR|nr:hypothetical protein E3N88_03684 [Mikania micrantha]
MRFDPGFSNMMFTVKKTRATRIDGTEESRRWSRFFERETLRRKSRSRLDALALALSSSQICAHSSTSFLTALKSDDLRFSGYQIYAHKSQLILTALKLDE